MRLLGKTVLLRIFGALAQFGLTLSVTRFTGAEAGLFFIGYSALQILAVVSRLGSELSAMREVAAAFHAAEPITLRDAILARVCIVMVTSITLAIGLAFFGKHLSSEVYFGYFVVSLPLLAMVGLLVEVLKAIDRADLGIFLLNVLVPLGGALGITFASLAGAADARSASLSILLSIALGLLIGMLALMHWFKRWKESSSEYVEL